MNSAAALNISSGLLALATFYVLFFAAIFGVAAAALSRARLISKWFGNGRTFGTLCANFANNYSPCAQSFLFNLCEAIFIECLGPFAALRPSPTNGIRKTSDALKRIKNTFRLFVVGCFTSSPESSRRARTRSNKKFKINFTCKNAKCKIVCPYFRPRSLLESEFLLLFSCASTPEHTVDFFLRKLKQQISTQSMCR